MSYYHKTEHVLEGDLHPADDNCPICGGCNRSRVFSVQRSPDVWLLRCHDCHVCSTSRMPRDETLEKLYAQYYSESTDNETEVEKFTFDKPDRLAMHIAKHAPKRELRDDPFRILDFGGGDGTISQLLGRILVEDGESDVQITLIDASQEAHVEREGIPTVVRSSLEEDDEAGRYDIVIASAVLEHIPYPAELFRSLLRSLNSGGVFYARTPYVVPLARLLPFAAIRSALCTYPFHVHDMGQAFWETILSTTRMPASFRLLKSRPSIVERTLEQDFVRALAAHSLKAGWYLFGRWYGLVGGWEVFIQNSDSFPDTTTDAE